MACVVNAPRFAARRASSIQRWLGGLLIIAPVLSVTAASRAAFAQGRPSAATAPTAGEHLDAPADGTAGDLPRVILSSRAAVGNALNLRALAEVRVFEGAYAGLGWAMSAMFFDHSYHGPIITAAYRFQVLSDNAAITPILNVTVPVADNIVAAYDWDSEARGWPVIPGLDVRIAWTPGVFTLGLEVGGTARGQQDYECPGDSVCAEKLPTTNEARLSGFVGLLLGVELGR
jgi:hypothetical protein